MSSALAGLAPAARAADVTVPANTMPASITLAASADAYVEEARAQTNRGSATAMRSDGGAGRRVETYVRFNVAGVGIAVQSAKLRLYASTSTTDGPAVYPASNTTWSETAITWANRPPRSTAGTADQGAIAGKTWVEFDVTPLVKGDGTYSFVLAQPGTDGVDLLSRESAFDRPQLIVTPASPVSPVPPASAVPPGFVAGNGSQFQLDGQRFRFTGLNLHQALMTVPVASCASWAANPDLEAALTYMGTGKEALRVYALQTYNTKNGVRDWTAFDATIAAAKAHNVRLIATLVDQWDYCEGPFKDQSWYEGGYKTTVFPNNTVPYRDYVREVVQRYRDEPTIMLWELANEPEIKPSETFSGCPAGALADMKAWASDVSTLIKSSDPNHLVSLGTGRGWCGLYDGDYQTVHALPSLDACSYHDYSGKSVMYSTDPRNGMQRRADQCHALNKPFYVGEAGIAIADEPDLQTRANDFDKKIVAQFGIGVEGLLVWNWSNRGSLYNWEVGPGDPTLGVLANR